MGVAEQAETRQDEAASIRDFTSEFSEESHQSVGAGQDVVLVADQADERQGCCLNGSVNYLWGRPRGRGKVRDKTYCALGGSSTPPGISMANEANEAHDEDGLRTVLTLHFGFSRVTD